MTVVASNYARKTNDLYQTEPWATEALLRHVDVRGYTVWEPAAGNHMVADVLRSHGASVVTSDIETYDRQHDATFDFLSTGPAVTNPPVVLPDLIITNPPYGPGNRHAVTFAERALYRCSGVVALLLTAKFDSGKTRQHLFADNSRFWGKITLLDRICWFPGGAHATGTEDHAWYVWRAGEGGRSWAPPLLLYEAKR